MSRQNFHVIATKKDDVIGRVDWVAMSNGEQLLISNGVPWSNVAVPPLPADLRPRDLPFTLFPGSSRPKVLIIGLGGGLDIMAAARRTNRITGVEASPAISSLMRHIYKKLCPEVRLRTMDGRRFIETHAESFDVILLPWTDTNNPQRTIPFELGLYTAESFALFQKRLSRSGILFLSKDWPSLAQILSSWRLAARHDPDFPRKIVLYAGLHQVPPDIRIMEGFLLYKKNGFSPEDCSLLTAEIRMTLAAELIYSPFDARDNIYTKIILSDHTAYRALLTKSDTNILPLVDALLGAKSKQALKNWVTSDV